MNIKTAIQMAIVAASQNDLGTAKKILAKILKRNPNLVEAWLVLAGVVETPDNTRRCLERVLKIDPGNQIALDGIAQLETSFTDLFKITRPNRLYQEAAPHSLTLAADQGTKLTSLQPGVRHRPSQPNRKTKGKAPRKQTDPWLEITIIFIAIICILAIGLIIIWLL